ncbi:unnamed protein product, partial [Arabidopsis halleri]
ETRHNQVRSELYQSYGNLTRLGKIDFPRFDGTKLKDWLFKVEEFYGGWQLPWLAALRLMRYKTIMH